MPQDHFFKYDTKIAAQYAKNLNATMSTISAVGSLVYNVVSASSQASSVTVSPTAVGDILICSMATFAGGGATQSYPPPTGGGVSVWNEFVQTGVDNTNGTSILGYWGVITSTGSQTLNFTYLSGISPLYCVFFCQQFHATGFNGPGSWSTSPTGQGGATASSGTPASSGNYGSITMASNQLWIGSAIFTAGSAITCGGSTSGFTYNDEQFGGGGIYAAQFLWNTGASGAVSPAWTTSISTPYDTCCTALQYGAIAAVGPFTASTAAGATLSVDPLIVGGLAVLYTGGSNGTTSITVSAVSGGGVTTWHQLCQESTDGNASIWWGVVTTAGSSTITVTASSTTHLWLGWQEFYAGNGTWSGDTNAVTTLSASSGFFPSVTPSVTNELCLALFVASGGGYDIGLNGSPSSFTAQTDNVIQTSNSISGYDAYCPTGAYVWSFAQNFSTTCLLAVGFIAFTPPNIVPAKPQTPLSQAVVRAANY